MKNNVLQQLLDNYQLSYAIVAGFLGVATEYVQGLATDLIKTDDIKIVQRLGLLFDLNDDDFDTLSSSIYSKYDSSEVLSPVKTR